MWRFLRLRARFVSENSGPGLGHRGQGPYTQTSAPANAFERAAENASNP